MGSFNETKYQDGKACIQTTLRSQSHMNLERINGEKPSQQYLVTHYKLRKRKIDENNEKLQEKTAEYTLF